ncbi:MAG: threonine/serine dehydratase, partial [Actinomycetota bacterium]
MVEVDDIEAAARTLDGVAHRTPVLTSRTLGTDVFVKCENLQRSGAFKFRGAYNKLASLTNEQRAAGVIAYSSGNHAGAVALAARLLRIPATIVMPHDAPAVKRAATEGYGAEVVGYDKRTERREPIATRLAEERGLTLVKPFDDPLIIAGQGTVGLELLDQVPDLDAVLVPVGGGGLIAGLSTAVKARSPRTTVIGVEPEAGDDHRRSKAAGERVSIGLPDTIADGLQAGQPGELTW